MVLQSRKSTLLQLRAVLVVAALICLCFSSNVGPRFLPLPALRTYLETSEPEHDGQRLFGPLRGEADGFRVPMVSQLQKRADRETQQPQSVALTLQIGLVLLNDARVPADSGHTVLPFSSPSLSQFFGRAPPV